MLQKFPNVPVFVLKTQRHGRTVALPTPVTFTGVRYQRLADYLTAQGCPAPPVPPLPLDGGGGGATLDEIQVAELYYVRDYLGPLRRNGHAVPEKVVGKLLGIGVKLLHERCEQLTGKSWASFLKGCCPQELAPVAPSPPIAPLLPVVAPAHAPAPAPASPMPFYIATAALPYPLVPDVPPVPDMLLMPPAPAAATAPAPPPEPLPLLPTLSAAAAAASAADGPGEEGEVDLLDLLLGGPADSSTQQECHLQLQLDPPFWELEPAGLSASGAAAAADAGDATSPAKPGSFAAAFIPTHTPTHTPTFTLPLTLPSMLPTLPCPPLAPAPPSPMVPVSPVCGSAMPPPFYLDGPAASLTMTASCAYTSTSSPAASATGLSADTLAAVGLSTELAEVDQFDRDLDAVLGMLPPADSAASFASLASSPPEWSLGLR